MISDWSFLERAPEAERVWSRMRWKGGLKGGRGCGLQWAGGTLDSSSHVFGFHLAGHLKQQVLIVNDLKLTHVGLSLEVRGRWLNLQSWREKERERESEGEGGRGKERDGTTDQILVLSFFKQRSMLIHNSVLFHLFQ